MGVPIHRDLLIIIINLKPAALEYLPLSLLVHIASWV